MILERIKIVLCCTSIVLATGIATSLTTNYIRTGNPFDFGMDARVWKRQAERFNNAQSEACELVDSIKAAEGSPKAQTAKAAQTQANADLETAKAARTQANADLETAKARAAEAARAVEELKAAQTKANDAVKAAQTKANDAAKAAAEFKAAQTKAGTTEAQLIGAAAGASFEDGNLQKAKVAQTQANAELKTVQTKADAAANAVAEAETQADVATKAVAEVQARADAAANAVADAEARVTDTNAVANAAVYGDSNVVEKINALKLALLSEEQPEEQPEEQLEEQEDVIDDQ